MQFEVGFARERSGASPEREPVSGRNEGNKPGFLPATARPSVDWVLGVYRVFIQVGNSKSGQQGKGSGLITVYDDFGLSSYKTGITKGQ